MIKEMRDTITILKNLIAGIFDSNGVITSGAGYSMTVTVAAGTRSALVSQFVLSPTAPVSAFPKMALMGVGR